MIVQIILIIALLIVAFLIAWRLLKSMVKAAFSISMLIIIGMLIYGLIIYDDFNNLQEALREDPTFILVNEEQEFYANVIIRDFETGDIDYYSQEELEEALEAGDKLFILINYEYLAANQSIVLEGLDINITPVLEEVFLSEDFEEVADLLDEDEVFIFGLESNFEDEEELKTFLFIQMISNLQEESNLILELGKGVRQGDVKFKPDYRSIRVLDYVPIGGEE